MKKGGLIRREQTGQSTPRYYGENQKMWGESLHEVGLRETGQSGIGYSEFKQYFEEQRQASKEI